VELNQPNWALRYGFFDMPATKNGFSGDDQFLMSPQSGKYGPFSTSWAMMTELERRYSINAHPGAIRFLAWLNEADMASYTAATALLLANPNNVAGDIAAARAYRYKYGFGLNWEQEIAKSVGLFSRLGWNDGHEEAWTFTDVNWTASLGVSVKGEAWRRPDDTFGLAGVVSGASGHNRASGVLADNGTNAGDRKAEFIRQFFQQCARRATFGDPLVALFRGHATFLASSPACSAQNRPAAGSSQCKGHRHCPARHTGFGHRLTACQSMLPMV